MGFHWQRVRRPEWLIGAGAVVLLVAMLMVPWFVMTTASGAPEQQQFFPQYKVDGWYGLHYGHWLLLLTIIIGLAAVITQARRKAPALPVTLAVFASLLGGLSALWLIIRVIISPPGGRAFGGWIGLLGALTLAYGGYRSAKSEGISPVDAPAEIPTLRLGQEGGT